MPRLVPEDLAVAYTGRPATTIRRWAHEGRISRYGHGRGRVRYDLLELHSKTLDDDGIERSGATPEMPAERRGRLAA
ncbi:DNA-binding protein [Kitasatospora sp. NBC_01302]|uniref:DNA-binding protein n=1 Tax=Kitasatospora sp. NBC_01302 TaxID=2903575 RepID=UPI002E15F713|nr:DNA-binding protein [Kitasatospora sp. NBC_01302]